jgi:hypothetical protein
MPLERAVSMMQTLTGDESTQAKSMACIKVLIALWQGTQ